jgi:hypothetical protein
MVSINQKWQEGAIPGKKLKKPSRTPEEVSQTKKQYEQKRSRSIKLHRSPVYDYSIQRYVIVVGFHPVLRFPPQQYN